MASPFPVGSSWGGVPSRQIPAGRAPSYSYSIPVNCPSPPRPPRCRNRNRLRSPALSTKQQLIHPESTPTTPTNRTRSPDSNQADADTPHGSNVTAVHVPAHLPHLPPSSNLTDPARSRDGARTLRSPRLVQSPRRRITARQPPVPEKRPKQPSPDRIREAEPARQTHHVMSGLGFTRGQCPCRRHPFATRTDQPQSGLSLQPEAI